MAVGGRRKDARWNHHSELSLPLFLSFSLSPLSLSPSLSLSLSPSGDGKRFRGDQPGFWRPTTREVVPLKSVFDAISYLPYYNFPQGESTTPSFQMLPVLWNFQSTEVFVLPVDSQPHQTAVTINLQPVKLLGPNLSNLGTCTPTLTAMCFNFGVCLVGYPSRMESWLYNFIFLS